jgi:hypothetical protein
MAIVKGLKNIEAMLDKPKFDNNGPRVTWLKLEDSQSVSVRFVNELDGDSPSYDEKNGLAIVVSEHTNPKDYKRKAACSAESEGRCFGCEMHRKDMKAGWRARLRFYINVLVDDGVNDPHIAVWSMGVAKSATFDTIREYVQDSQSLSSMTWKLKRNGKGTETTYILIPIKQDEEKFDWSKHEIPDLEAVVKEVPYAEQESFYLGFDNPSVSTSVDW